MSGLNISIKIFFSFNLTHSHIFPCLLYSVLFVLHYAKDKGGVYAYEKTPHKCRFESAYLC